MKLKISLKNEIIDFPTCEDEGSPPTRKCCQKCACRDNCIDEIISGFSNEELFIFEIVEEE